MNKTIYLPGVFWNIGDFSYTIIHRCDSYIPLICSHIDGIDDITGVQCKSITAAHLCATLDLEVLSRLFSTPETVHFIEWDALLPGGHVVGYID